MSSYKNQLNQLLNKLRGSGSQKKIEAIQKVADKILSSHESKVDSLISPLVAVNQRILETNDLSEKKIVVVFENYNQSVCELCDLNATTSRALTSKLKHLTSTKIKDLPSSGLIRDDVNCDGEYEVLYRNLEPDVAIKEVSFAGEARFFGFFNNEFFSLVTVWINHANTR